MIQASRFALILGGIGFLAGSSALAQPQKPAPQKPAQKSPAQKSTTPPVLQGPKVTEGGVPGEQRQFAPGRVKGKDQMGGEIPHRLFMRAIENLRAGDTDPALRLTPDQSRQVRTINDDFAKSVNAYREEHKAEAQALLTKLSPEDRRRAQEFLRRGGMENRRPALDKRTNVSKKDLDRKPDQKPGDMPGDMMDAAPGNSKQSEDARARLKDLFDGAPSAADTHARLFGVLNEGQRKAFEKELDSLRSEMNDGKGLEKATKKVQGKLADKDQEEMSLQDPRLPENARKRLESLSPEQRKEALERFRNRRQKKNEAPQLPNSAMDDVAVPKPK